MVTTGSTDIRTGQSSLPQGTERVHILIMHVNERPGAVDRVVGVLRRRRAAPHSLTLTQTVTPNVVRISAQVKDSEVAIDQLVEQLRKLVDVRQLQNLISSEVMARELLLLKVNSTSESKDAIARAVRESGARILDLSSDIVTLEFSGSQEQVQSVISTFEGFGIREIARSGLTVLARANH